MMHRPERWGYVQFMRDPGKFVPDAAVEVREKLMRVYEAQRAFHQKNRFRGLTPLEILLVS